MFQYEAKILSITDGDTLKLLLDLGFHVHVEEIVRLARVNAPETVKYTIGGLVDPAKTFIVERIPPGSVCVASITRQEKYGRWLAEILYLPGSGSRDEILRAGKNLNDELLAVGLVKAYSGGKRTDS